MVLGEELVYSHRLLASIHLYAEVLIQTVAITTHVDFDVGIDVGQRLFRSLWDGVVEV